MMTEAQEKEFQSMRLRVAVMDERLNTLTKLAWLQIGIMATGVAGLILNAIPS